LSGTFWYLEPFLRHRGPNKRKQHPPPLILGNYYPDRAVQGKLSIPSLGKYFKRVLTQVNTFLRPLAPDKLFSKTVFFKISLKPLEISKKWTESNLTSMRSSLFFDIFYGFRDIRVQRIAQITTLPKLGGNNGPIVLFMGGSRFDANCNIYRNFHPNRSTLSSDIHWQTFSLRQTDTHT